MRISFVLGASLVLTIITLGACRSATTDVQVASTRPIVQSTKVVVTPPVNGVITVQGLPGAVSGSGATTIAIAVTREAATERTTQHLGHGVRQFYTTHATVGPDGAFEPVTLGDAQLPVQVDDELNFTLYQDSTPVGLLSSMMVPAVPAPYDRPTTGSSWLACAVGTGGRALAGPTVTAKI
jgi:hypothetical protein